MFSKTLKETEQERIQSRCTYREKNPNLVPAWASILAEQQTPPRPKTGNRNNDVLAVESHVGKSMRWPFRLPTGEHSARASPALVTLGGISVESSEARCHTRRRAFSCSHTMARSTSGEVIGLSSRVGWVRLRAPPAGWSGSFRCSTRIFPARPADSGPNPPKVG